MIGGLLEDASPFQYKNIARTNASKPFPPNTEVSAFFSGDESTDRLAKIRPVVDFFNNKMKSIYYPCRELFLNESMVLWKVKLIFKQFIKNMRHNYGIKLYLMETY